MKKMLFATVLAVVLPATSAVAQTETQTLDTLVVPADFLTPTESFKTGLGVGIDTLNIGDGRLSVVLKDDHTWHYIKNFDVVGQDQVFREYWNTTSMNPYPDISLSSLPTHNSICLVDSASNFVVPFKVKVFSKFGYRRGRRHQGVDLPLKIGDPVSAAFDGRVRFSAYTKGYGNLVIIRHENGLETYYGHLSKRHVESGDWVHAGDVIGLGGSTGRSTGPHLHFETRYQGFAFDPQWIVDFEKGELRKNVFVLRRSYLNASSRYVPESLDEEEEIYATDEQIAAEEERLEAERKAIRYHTVKSGETVSAIGRKYGLTLSKIKQLNPGLNVDKIRLGQKIRVN